MDKEATMMRQEMDRTLAGLTHKLGELEHEVSGTLRTVQDSVNTVRDSVNTVRDTFDLRLHVRQRPWTLLAGATALGFLGGFHSVGRSTGHPMQDGRSASTPLACVPASEHPSSGANGGTDGAGAAGLSTAPAPSWLANLGEKFKPEFAELKGVAIGVLVGLVRDIVARQVLRPTPRSERNANNGSDTWPQTEEQMTHAKRTSC